VVEGPRESLALFCTVRTERIDGSPEEELRCCVHGLADKRSAIFKQNKKNDDNEDG